MTTISIIIITAACFLAAAVNLTVESKYRKRILSLCSCMALLAGFGLYSYGYAHVCDSVLIAVIHTIMSVCQMFGGGNNLEAIQAAPLFAQKGVLLLFWLAHFMAFYATAGAAAATIGNKLLRQIRLRLIRHGTLLVIYGTNAHAIEYGQRQLRELKRSVVFIGQADQALSAAIHAAGGVLEPNGEQPDKALLRRLGIRPGKRRLEIAALSEDGMKNLAFAQSLMTAFECAGILADQTTLLIRDVEEDQAGALIGSEDRYGYGSVMTFNEYELAARLMVQKLPPCDAIRFDDQAQALENFEVLIIGFGRLGRSVLDALLMNGQFCGSTFRADIFDPHAQSGTLFDHELLRQYDIRFHQNNGASEALYAFLAERRDAVRYIAVCTGNEKANREIAHDLSCWLKARGVSPALVACTPQTLSFVRPGEITPVYQSIYGSDALDLERIDSMAMAINHAYCEKSDRTPRENWMHCDYFSRMSSRASADFYPAMLRAAGKTMEQVTADNWHPQGELLENLAITEHLRWCAFHYVMGFHPMSEAEYARRIDRYQAEVRQKGASTLRIGKDMVHRTHACLIPWDQLDQLSDRENAVTGGHEDYKQRDRNNILVLPQILSVLNEQPEHPNA